MTATVRSVAHLAYGNALRTLRTEKGLSQESLALNAGMDRSFVSAIERGERNPSLSKLLKLSEILDVPFSEWVRRAEND